RPPRFAGRVHHQAGAAARRCSRLTPCAPSGQLHNGSSGASGGPTRLELGRQLEHDIPPLSGRSELQSAGQSGLCDTVSVWCGIVP
ncbi:MAG: hypothetical protein KC766_40450, partial [Myxococcales bacterium]|nr:hypothetical protein [Myxococcales bacterium]